MYSRADTSATNRLGQSAEDIARFWGFEAAVEILRNDTSRLLPPPPTYPSFDRCGEVRQNIDFLQAALKDHGTRFIVFNKLDPLVSIDEYRLIWARPPDVSHLLPSDLWEETTKKRDVEVVFLGRAMEGATVGYAVYGVSVTGNEAETLSSKLRGEFVSSYPGLMRLRGRDGDVARYCRSLLAWHDRHCFCPTCGSGTSSVEGGHKRVCFDKECRSRKGVHNTCHPRIDPTVIVFVQSADGSRCVQVDFSAEIMKCMRVHKRFSADLYAHSFCTLCNVKSGLTKGQI